LWELLGIDGKKLWEFLINGKKRVVYHWVIFLYLRARKIEK
tara:strand:- start:121 stop:243 length:123 start_codon:yes stop_codon:yes gene_type:complete